MTAKAIITGAIQTRTDEVETLIEYRNKLRQMADLLTTDTIIEDWNTATENIDRRLNHLGVPQ